MQRGLVLPIGGHAPRTHQGVFLAPMTALLGRVTVGSRSSVWYGSVLRADEEDIILGEDCNVQDGCILHADVGFPVVLDDRVTLGHGAVVHGARIESDVLVGMQATILNGAHVGTHSIIAAGTVVLEGTRCPAGSMVAGVPGRVVRDLRAKDRESIREAWIAYREKAQIHLEALRTLEDST